MAQGGADVRAWVMAGLVHGRVKLPLAQQADYECAAHAALEACQRAFDAGDMVSAERAADEFE